MSTNTNHSAVEVYLFFNGNCEAALEFYRQALGAKVEFMMRYKESPEPAPPGRIPPGFENKIMHCHFRIGDTSLMASDGCENGNAKYEGFSLTLGVATEDEAQKAFNALSQGGKVEMPLTKTFWSPLFGMVQDKFGIGWMVNVVSPNQK